MIKKSQIRFIVTIMSILLVVFAVIFGISCFFLKKSSYNSISEKLNEIERLYSFNDFNEKCLVVSLQGDDYIIVCNTANFSEETISAIVFRSLLFNSEMPNLSVGSIDNIYFKINSVSHHTTLFAGDMTEYFITFKNNVLKLFIFFLIIYCILFLIVWGLSVKVFEPINATFYKQQRFISDASHELKTPVAVISANADVIKTTENSKYLESIKSQTKRLNLLISDMLTLAKTEEITQTVLKEDFSLSDAIYEVALPFDALAFESQKTLDFDIEPDIFINADREGLKKILNILVDNAVKYCSKNGIVKVSLKNKTITVFNTGSEILDADSDKIFERFYRGDSSRSRESGGSGLGLAIAKSIANLNKWKLSAKSKYGESMTITLIL